MPKKNNWDDLKEVYKYEKLYRTHEEEFKVDDVLNLNIAEYWKQSNSAFRSFSQI